MLLLAASCLLGCAHHPTPETKSPDRSSPTTTSASTKPFPVLYHRTGGIAGTDDRVIIWPDGVVQVEGHILTPANRRFRTDRFDRLMSLLRGWSNLKDQYLASNAADAYTITISYGGKSVEASDLASDLPEQFRQVFGEIEAIAADAAATIPPVEEPGPP
jgi:hypothetical protein